MWKGARRAPRTTRKKTAPRKHALQTQSKIAIRRRKIRALKFAAAIVMIVFLFGAVSQISFLPALSVQTVNVEGAQEVKPLALKSYLQQATAQPAFYFFSRQNIGTYPAAAMEQELLFEFPELQSATIDRKFFKRAVEVRITEREPYVVWCVQQEGSNCYFVDADGFIYGVIERDEKASSLVRVFGGVSLGARTTALRARIVPEYFLSLRDFVAELKRQDLQVQTIVLEENDAHLTIEPGWELRIALTTDLGAVAFNLTAILDDAEFQNKEEINYIDMRFDNRVFYKVGESEADTEE